MNKKQIEKLAAGVLESINTAEADFTDWTKKNQAKILDAIMSEIKQMPNTDGKLGQGKSTTEFIASLPRRVRAALKKTGYLAKTDGYIRQFEKVGQLQIDLHKQLNDLEVGSVVTPIRATWAQITAQNLAGQGMDNIFVAPLQNELLKHAAGGLSLAQMEEAMRQTIAGSPDAENTTFTNYSLRISRDALGQYDGAVNAKIADQFDLNAIVYVGSVVDDTRAQCERWLESEFILIADLPDEIDWAYSNGKGMIAGTTPANFMPLRGGYNCRHQAVPIRVTDAQIAAGTLEPTESE